MGFATGSVLGLVIMKYFLWPQDFSPLKRIIGYKTTSGKKRGFPTICAQANSLLELKFQPDGVPPRDDEHRHR